MSLRVPQKGRADNAKRQDFLRSLEDRPYASIDETTRGICFVAVPHCSRPLPDWGEVHRELRRPGGTLQLLLMEYKQRCPEGFQYTWFTEHYRLWARHLDVVMRQEHRAGEKLFVDFPGKKGIKIVDARTGVITPAQLFVAVLGASNHTYAAALPSQELPHWITDHVLAFEYFGGVPQITVCDNLRAGVSRAHRYEPYLNATFNEMASHYGCAVIPARPRRPRDDARPGGACWRPLTF